MHCFTSVCPLFVPFPSDTTDSTDSEKQDASPAGVTVVRETEKKVKKRKYGTIRETGSDTSGRTSHSSASHTYNNIDLDALAKRDVTTTKVDKNAVFAANDIRSRYSEIFCEAFNNFDKTIFSQLMRDYCEQELLVIYEYVGVNAYNSPKYLEVRGLDTVAVFWDSMLTSMPDSLFVVYSTKYKILPNHYTSIVCTFSFKGTKVYELKGLNEELREQNVVLSTEQPSPVRPSVLQGSDNQVIVTSFKPPSSSPVPDAEKGKKRLIKQENAREQAFDIERSELISKYITVIGTLTYYVNPSKKIYQMSFVHSVKQ